MAIATNQVVEVTTSSQAIKSLVSKEAMDKAIKRFERNGVLPKLDYSDSYQGEDKDQNGVRDDIDAYIASLPDTEVQKRSLTQLAKYEGLKANFSQLTEAEVTDLAKNLLNTAYCVNTKYSDSVGEKRYSDLTLYLANTEKRAKLIDVANSSINDEIFNLDERELKEGHTGCEWEDSLIKKNKKSKKQ